MAKVFPHSFKVESEFVQIRTDPVDLDPGNSYIDIRNMVEVEFAKLARVAGIGEEFIAKTISFFTDLE